MAHNQQNIVDYIKQVVSNRFQNYQPDQINVCHLSGLTNQVFKVACQGKQSLIFRKFGVSCDSKLDNEIFKSLQKTGIAPKCLFSCESYRIEQYIENAVHPSVEILMRKDIKKKIFELMYRYHNSNVQALKQKQLLIKHILSCDYLQKIRQHQNDRSDQNFKKLYNEFEMEYENLNQLKRIIFQQDEQQSAKIRLCHNDLNNLNMFCEPDVIFIDYQYSAYNYFYYDIANFLNQSTFNYQVKEYPKFKIQRQLTLQEISQAAQLYPQYYQGLDRDIIKGLVACNLYWAGWSLIMANDPAQVNFGAVEHGLTRMELFRFYKKLL